MFMVVVWMEVRWGGAEMWVGEWEVMCDFAGEMRVCVSER